MRRRLTANVIVAGSLIVLAACNAGPATQTESSQPDLVPAASPIPPVKNPRDIAAMAQRPCELLTAQQAREFGLDLPPEQLGGLLGTQRCKWTTTAPDRQIVRTVDVSLFTNNSTLEVAYYQDRNRPFFELTEISGYPAIVTRPKAELPVCDIDIKTAERQSFTVSYDADAFRSDPQQACVVGRQVAAAVIGNLPPKR